MPLTTLLASLGDTPDAVAATLLVAGVRGPTRDPYRNPLAVYLSRATGEPATVTVGWAYAGGERARMPDAVLAWLRRFERREYPRLLASRWWRHGGWRHADGVCVRCGAC